MKVRPYFCINIIRNLPVRHGFVFSFILGFVIRLIPEILSYPYPIGFDTVRDVAILRTGIVWRDLKSVFSTWLLYAILTPIYQAIQIDPFLLMKLAAPMLYALNVCGVYHFSKRTLGWKANKPLYAAVFFAFQLASLRLSWDLHRNMLGLGIFLFALPFFCRVKAKKDFLSVVLFSTLVVFSHELVSVIMFVLVLTLVLSNFLRRERTMAFKTLAAISPALTIFLTSIYLIMFSEPLRSEINVISTYQPSSPGGLFFLTDYLNLKGSHYYYPTYLDLASHVLSLFGLLYLLSLILVFIGFFRDRMLDAWTLLLLIGSFNSLVTPYCALGYWYKFMFMLVYPFTFYAVNGLDKALKSQGKGMHPNFRWLRWLRISNRRARGILLLMFFLALLLMAGRYGDYGAYSIPTTSIYFPSSMLYNTVPLRDVDDTIKTFEWLNIHMTRNSSVLVHHAFMSWARLYLEERHMIIWYERDVVDAFDVALVHGFNPIYLIWWNRDIGWYDVTIPPGFVSAFSKGRISVFQLEY